MPGLNIDILMILLLWNVQSVSKNAFESSQGGRLNSQIPNTSIDLSLNLVYSLSLNLLDCSAEVCKHLYQEFCVNTSFSLVCRFLDTIRILKQSPADSCVIKNKWIIKIIKQNIIPKQGGKQSISKLGMKITYVSILTKRLIITSVET